MAGGCPHGNPDNIPNNSTVNSSLVANTIQNNISKPHTAYKSTDLIKCSQNIYYALNALNKVSPCT